MAFDLRSIDRRVIYLFVFIALSVPLLARYVVPPAPMGAAELMFKIIEETEPTEGKVALVALDFGPNLKAENGSQAAVVIEHLMRRRIPVALFSLYAQAEPFLFSIPAEVVERLTLERPDERWVYGKDWVNLGYRPGGFQIVQSLAKVENLAEFLRKDALGNNLSELSAFRNIRTLRDVPLFVEFTGLVGMIDTYIQFLQSRDFRPTFLHGCTSITIPDAYIYLDSGQLSGLLEGIAGAAWYSELLDRTYPGRVRDDSLVINTSLGIAHLVIILLIAIGNLGLLFARRRRP